MPRNERAWEVSSLKASLITADTLRCRVSTLLSGDIIEIPRITLAITNAISLAFPKETQERRRQIVKLVSELSPILIATNEAADLGISARLRRNKRDSQENVLLSGLEEVTFGWMERSVEGFKKRHPDEKTQAKIDRFVGDALMLSENRGTFKSEEWRQYLELDSIIYILSIIDLTLPETLSGWFDFKKIPQNIEALRNKYELFLIGEKDKVLIPELEDPKNLANFSKTMALLGSEMVLKVHDDLIGEDLDRKLGVPNFIEYARVICEQGNGEDTREQLRKIINQYKFVAETGGLPPFSVRCAEKLCRITSLLKARANTLNPPNIEDSINKNTTTLRHELNYSGVIDRLFATPTPVSD